MGHRSFGFFLVFIGGGFGSMLRHTVNQASAAVAGINFPYGTLAVNVTGSLLIGVVAGALALRGHGGQTLPLFLTTGVLGGFTTFSAFSLDAVLLWERGDTAAAVAYVLGSLVMAVVGVVLGLAIMRALLA
jgi:CrcB protein